MGSNVLSLLLVVCMVGYGLTASYSVDLKRVPSMRESLIKEGTWEIYDQWRQARAFFVRDAGFQPEEDYSDTIYVAIIDLGTPAQKFAVVLDTGSSNLWIPDSTCSAGGCAQKHNYASDNSSTYVKNGLPWSIQYGTGAASGFLGQDNFCFGETGLCFDKQVFGQATNVAAFFARQPIDGICGMAFKRIAVDGITPPFINMLPHLDNPYFTVWMTAEGDVKPTSGGRVTYGALDADHCSSDMTWVPLSSATYYQFSMSGVKVGDTSFDGGEAISDTGTSLIAGPTSVVNKMCTALGGTYNPSYGLYTIGCNATAPDVTFTIDGNDYVIRSKNFILPLGIPGTCILGFQGMGGRQAAKYANNDAKAFPTWILGDCFIREYCNIYDPKNQRVGLAKALK